jgi:hypothetical protein
LWFPGSKGTLGTLLLAGSHETTRLSGQIQVGPVLLMQVLEGGGTEDDEEAHPEGGALEEGITLSAICLTPVLHTIHHDLFARIIHTVKNAHVSNAHAIATFLI